MRPHVSPDAVCPNCRATLASSEGVVKFESVADGTVTLVECPSCRAVVSPKQRTANAGRDPVYVSPGRRVNAHCDTCAATISLVIPEGAVVNDRRPDGVVHAKCDHCAGVTAVGFRRNGLSGNR